MNFAIECAGVRLANPLVLASGILGSTGASLANVVRCGAGAVTTKSVSREPRTGHPGPIIITYPGGMLNAVGLSNPGIEAFLEELRIAMGQSDAPVIPSIFSGSGSYEEFGELAEQIAALNPPLIEVDISCPHVEGVHFANDPEKAAKVTKVVKQHAGTVPVSMKLSPNVPDIANIARAVEAAGADCITAVNTAGPGMAINIEARKPVLGNKKGGLSGSALKPIAIRCVYEIYDAVKIPIIGTGGVTTGRDAIEMMMAGATAVGIGTGLWSRGENAFAEILGEMEEWMGKEGVKDARELIGVAH